MERLASIGSNYDRTQTSQHKHVGEREELSLRSQSSRFISFTKLWKHELCMDTFDFIQLFGLKALILRLKGKHFSMKVALLP